ncbi:MAG: hypothetical protein ABII82_11855 [Verrucomicrobiota bacterium]
MRQALASHSPFMASHDPRLLSFINDYAACCDGDDLPATVLCGQGYHTTVPNGTVIRRTRDAMDYALALLEDGRVDSVARALRIIPRVLALQDREPCNRTFGIWPWFFEEPISAMRPPDWNWADFIGVRLAHMLGRHADVLPGDLQTAMTDALGDAALSIFRRNIGPDYTNIAVKGGVVAVMAGERLGRAFLVDYGRARLARFLAHTRDNGGFTEYNSPPYGALVILEVERGLLLVKDPATRDSLRAIHALCWRGIANSLHPPTGQLCGPHARAYDDTLSATHSELLGAELGVPLFLPAGMPEPHERGRDIVNLLLIPRLPCPDDVRRDILDAPRGRLVRQDYVRSPDPEVRRQSTMWFDGDACLGSVNVENLWQQRRPAVAYWKVGDTVAMLRVRLTHGGRDFASGVLRTAQAGPELLSVCSLVTNKADSHDHMDLPPDGVFRLDQLALCVELTAPDARVSGDAAAGYELAAGDRTVAVRPSHAEFGGHPVAWEIRAEPGKASVRAVINGGAPVALVPAQMRNVAIGFRLALQPPGEPLAAPDVELADDAITLTANGPHGPLAITSPRHPQLLR